MFRLISAEFKKIFKKTGIFVVTGLLIFVLAASVFTYSPFERTNMRSNITGNSVNDIFQTFNNDSVQDTKVWINDYLQNAQDYINFYSITTDLKAILQTKVDTLQSLYNTYIQKLLQASIYPQAVVDARNNLKTAFTNFLDYYRQNVVVNTDYIYVLATDEVNTNVNSIVAKCINLFNEDVSNNNDNKIINDLDAYNFYTKLSSYVDELVPFIPNAEFVASLNDYITVASERIDDIYAQIVTFNNANSSSTASEDYYEINTLISNYKLTVIETYNIVRESIQLNVLNKYSNSKINTYNGFENANLYEMKEDLSRNQYLFENQTYDYEYANVFSTSAPSNQETNAYDFSYYALRLCAFIIIIYIVVLGAGAIAGEQSSGTLKFLAIRPYSRGKILTSKILSVLLVGGLLLAISSVVTLIIGGITYGVASLPILVTFNATSTFTINPSFLYILMFLSTLIEMSFFAVISIAISTIFTSSVGAVAISIFVYFLTMVLNSLLLTAPVLQYVPLTCSNLFRFFGGSFLSTRGGLIDVLLTPGIAAGTNFYVSLSILIASMGLMLWLTYYIFKKRDIK